MRDESQHEVAAHDQAVTHRYTIHYPEHPPRSQDPHYHDFEEYKRRRRADGTWHCDFAAEYRAGDTSECDLTRPLECHHRIIEFSLQNGVDLELLEADYPGVSKTGVGEWIETAPNLELLCVAHHRGHGGVHVVSASDWEAAKYVRDLFC
jgi:hypothetical protein